MKPKSGFADDVDFFAAAPPAPAGQKPQTKKTPNSPQPRAPRATREGQTPKQPPALVSSNNLENNDILYNQDSIIEDRYINEASIDIKGKLTLQELKFLEIYFTTPYSPKKGRMTIEKAMIAAGYTNISQRERYRIAAKIVKKYEDQTEDARKIFQDIGFGPVEIAKGIKALAKTARSEMVKLNAHGMAAKASRMLREPEQTHQGVQIIINCASPSPGQGQGPPVQVNVQEVRPAIPKPKKPLQITD